MRKNYRRKRYTKKRTYKKNKGNSWYNTASKALRIATKVAGLVNAEYKFVDTTVANTASTFNGVVNILNTIAQGVDVSQREGDSVKIKNLTIRGQVASSSADVIRMIVYWDEQNLVGTGAEFLQNVGTANAPYAFKDEDNKYRTVTLLDKTWSVYADKPVVRFDEVVKIDRHTHYQATLTAIKTGALKILFINTVNGTGATFNYVARVSYIDN